MTRRPSHGRRRRGRAAAGKPSDPRRERILFWAQVLGAVFGGIAALAAVAAFVPIGWLEGSDASDSSSRSEGRLEVEQVVVRNGWPDYREDDAEAGGVQTLASAPTVALTLLNEGNHRVLLTEARVEIEDYASFHICYSQGGGPVPVSGRYAIRLPTAPLPSERTVQTSLQPPQQLGPDEAARIELRFGTDGGMDADHLYALRVKLRTSDDGEEIDVGRFVLAFPGVFPGFGDLPAGFDTFSQKSIPDEKLLGISWCYRRHIADLRRLLAHPGAGSPELAELRDVRPAAWWEERQIRMPAQLAAPQLLRAGDPVLAVYAAKESGDAALVDRTRAAAADALVEQARDYAKADAWSLAVVPLKEALRIAPSDEAEELLAEATREANK